MNQSKTKTKKNNKNKDNDTIPVIFFVVAAVVGVLILASGCATTEPTPVVDKNNPKAESESKQDTELHYPHFHYRDLK